MISMVRSLDTSFDSGRLLLSFLPFLSNVLSEYFFCQFCVPAVLIDTVLNVSLIGVGVMELEAEIEGHVSPSLLQLIQQYLHIHLWFSLKSEVESFLLKVGLHDYCMITKEINAKNIISNLMFLKHLNSFKFSQFYHPSKFTINL